MIAYLCTIGEKTEQVCYEQLVKFGYRVIILDKKEEWITKYKRFIAVAEDDCIRIDADIIPNENIRKLNFDYGMTQHKIYDFYKNNISIGGIICYRKDVLKILKENIDKISEARPETSAWRLEEVLPYTYTRDLIIGMHGFFQDKRTMERAENNKKNRSQINKFDFNLVKQLNNLL